MSLSPKDPAERVNVTFDFTNTDATVSNPEVLVAEKGTLVDIPDMKYSAPVISVDQKSVAIMITGGTSGQQYDLRCTVDLSNGERIVAKDTLAIKQL